MPIEPPPGGACTGGAGVCAPVSEVGAEWVLAGAIASLAGIVGAGANGGAPVEAAWTGVPAESANPLEKACKGSVGAAPTGAGPTACDALAAWSIPLPKPPLSGLGALGTPAPPVPGPERLGAPPDDEGAVGAAVTGDGDIPDVLPGFVCVVGGRMTGAPSDCAPLPPALSDDESVGGLLACSASAAAAPPGNAPLPPALNDDESVGGLLVCSTSAAGPPDNAPLPPAPNDDAFANAATGLSSIVPSWCLPSESPRLSRAFSTSSLLRVGGSGETPSFPRAVSAAHLLTSSLV